MATAESKTPKAPASNTASAVPNLDLLLDPGAAGNYRMKLKEGQGPLFVRKGMVTAGQEFVTDASHARELLQTGAADVLGKADAPDLTPAEEISRAAAVAEGNPAAYKPGVLTDLDEPGKGK